MAENIYAEAIRRHRSELSSLLQHNVTTISSKLLSKGLVTNDVHDCMLANESIKVKAEKMISCVVDRVLQSPTTGLDFFVVLEEDAYFQDIAKTMRSFCLGECQNCNNTVR